MRWLASAAAPLLRGLPPETAHALALAALRFAPLGRAPSVDPKLETNAFGLSFRNPLGLAAGFDKDALATDGALALGFGFVEVGTLTPRPQEGNPRPRLFRLSEDAAIINRMGLNNLGFGAAHARLARRRRKGVVGVNVGPNKDASDRAADFALGVTTFADVASYVAINVSSPNTPGLRDLQRRDALDDVIARAINARDAAPIRRPLLLKIAPDIDIPALDDIVQVAKARRVDGMIVSNTTVERRKDLKSARAKEVGGLSGRPLFAASTRLLACAFERVDRQFPLIGCGGVEDGETALAKIEAGASLIQVYTGFVFRGPRLIDEALTGLSRAMSLKGAKQIADLVGARASDWAAERS